MDTIKLMTTETSSPQRPGAFRAATGYKAPFRPHALLRRRDGESPSADDDSGRRGIGPRHGGVRRRSLAVQEEVRPAGTANPDDAVARLLEASAEVESPSHSRLPLVQIDQSTGRAKSVHTPANFRAACCWPSRRVLPTFAIIGVRSSSWPGLDGAWTL